MHKQTRTPGLAAKGAANLFFLDSNASFFILATSRNRFHRNLAYSAVGIDRGSGFLSRDGGPSI